MAFFLKSRIKIFQEGWMKKKLIKEISLFNHKSHESNASAAF